MNSTASMLRHIKRRLIKWALAGKEVSKAASDKLCNVFGLAVNANPSAQVFLKWVVLILYFWRSEFILLRGQV
jgi:hypothetical protein